LSTTQRPPRPTLLPYPTLFRSTRVSPSFVRFGSFEHWAGKPEQLRTLTDYVIDRHFREFRHTASGEPDTWENTVLRMLREVVRRDRKSTRLNSSHVKMSYAASC